MIEKSSDHIVDYLLFAHAFTGCDTTSAIHKFGKTGLFKKLSTSSSLRKTAATFYEDKLPEEVRNAYIRFFELLHSPSESLPQKTRKQSMNKWLHLIVQPLIPLSFHRHREQPFTTGREFTIRLKFGEI